MNDADITKLTAKLMTILATKEDLKDLATKDDLQGVKGDIQVLDEKIDNLDKKLSKAIKILDKKTDTILEYAEAVDEAVDKYGKRLRNIERIPIIVHELKKPTQIIKS